MRTAATDMQDFAAVYMEELLLESRRTTTVSPAHMKQLWYGVLQGLRPVATGRSLHVTHQDYEIGGRRFTAFWLLSDLGDAPCDIEVYDPSVN